MEPHIRRKFTPDVLAAVAQIAGVTPTDLTEHGGFEAMVHEVPSQSTFLKSTWSGRRTPEQIEAEMTFVEMLADDGVSVARPVRLDGQLVVSVPVEGGAFHVSATKRAPGASIYRTELLEEHFVAWGKLLAQMHAVAARPAARPLIARRPSWREEHQALVRHAADARVRERYTSLLDQLEALPEHPETFGIMHTDVHAANVHWDGTTPTAFDFDDCIGFWYASDIAIVLFYTLDSLADPTESQDAYEHNYTAVRRGYESVRQLPASAWDTIPLFMNLRDAVLFLVCERSIPAEVRSGRFADVMASRFERVANSDNAMGLRF